MSRRQNLPVVRRTLGLLLCLLLVAGCSGAGPGPEDADRTAAGVPAAGYLDEPYQARPGAILGVPVEDSETQAAEHAVVARLIELIRHTPPGERIRIITRSFSLHPVADALAEAHERGVDVQIIANRFASKSFKAIARLTELLGTDRRADSFVFLSTGSKRGPDTGTHQKTWTFTRTGDSRRVVLVGSANLSYYSTTQYSDMYAFVGRRDVWRAFDRDFGDQVGVRKALVGPGHQVDAGRDRIWFFPGWDLDTDPVQALLRAAPLRGLQLRFAMYAWHSERGKRLAEIVAAKSRAGAKVTVIALNIGKEIVRILEDAGVEVHDAKFDNGQDVHSKLSLVSWTDDDGVRQRRIITGSDNFGTDSLPRDEVVVEINANADVRQGQDWKAYIRWYDAMIARADREGH